MASSVEKTVTAPTTVAEKSTKLSDRIARNPKPVTYGAVAVAVVLVGGWLFLETGKRKDRAGADALDRARTTFEGGNLPTASSEFQRVAQSFRGTEAGFAAELALNEVRLASGQTQIAVDELKKFAESNPPPFWASGAWTMMGAGLENLTKFAEAAKAYSKSADLAVESYRKVEASLSAARAYRLGGQEAQAVEILRGVVSKFGKEIPGVPEAEVRLAELTKGTS
jgi:tetratricopeptide (TPR) repeat protein